MFETGTLNESQGKNSLAWVPVSLTGKVRFDSGQSCPLSLAWPHSCHCLFSVTFSISIFPFSPSFIWQMSSVRTDHRQTQPGGQPLEENIQMWVDRTRHRSSFGTCEVRKEAGGLLSIVVFGKMNAFLSSPQGTWINGSSESERPWWAGSSVPGALHNLSHTVLSIAPSGRCHWLLLHLKKLEAQRSCVTYPRPQCLFPGGLI